MDATPECVFSGDELNEAKKRAAVLLAQGLRNKEVGNLVSREATPASPAGASCFRRSSCHANGPTSAKSSVAIGFG